VAHRLSTVSIKNSIMERRNKMCVCLFESFDESLDCNCKTIKAIVSVEKPERCKECGKNFSWAYKLCKSKSSLLWKGGKSAKKKTIY
jgi:hypothetical protein